MVITNEWIGQNATGNGGWTKQQLACVGFKSTLRGTMEKRCDHSNGWYTDKAMIWLDKDVSGITIYTDVFGGHQGRVKLRCNVSGCEAIRYVYLRRGDWKVSAPRYPRKKSDGR